MRQISAAIDEAAWIEAYKQRQLVAWQTRMLCAWLVKLTPDMTPEMSKNMMEEVMAISLDQVTENASDPTSQKPKVSPGLPTRKDFYNMSDDEIEASLGTADNGNGSFEQLMAGFQKG